MNTPPHLYSKNIIAVQYQRYFEDDYDQLRRVAHGILGIVNITPDDELERYVGQYYDGGWEGGVDGDCEGHP
jgi:hypothetical protein